MSYYSCSLSYQLSFAYAIIQDGESKSLLRCRIVVTILVVICFLVSSLVFLIRLVLGEFKCHKPSLDSLPSQFNVTNIGFDKLYDILLTIMEFLHIPEYGLLTYYLFQFIIKYKCLNGPPAFRDFMEIEKMIKLILIVLVGIIFIALAILLPILKLVFIYKLQIEISPHEQCDQSIGYVIIILDCTYHVISIINKIFIVLVRLMMMYFTLMIRCIWKTEGSNEQNASSPQYSNQDKYDIVTSIYKIFRSFFAFQLIIHLFGLIFHLAHLTRIWTQHTHGREIVIDANLLVTLHRVYQLLHLIFDFLALIFAHKCAMKMNKCVEKYGEKLKQELYFTPKIPGICKIPISDLGFVFSLAFGVFGMILTFIFL